MTDYITIANSTGTISKKFLLIDQQRVNQRIKQLTPLTSGYLTIVQGRPQPVYAFTIMVEETPDSGYGSLANLRTLFSYRNPAASPSNVLTITLLDGSQILAVLTSDLPEDPFTVVMFGANAYYKVDFTAVDVTTPMLDFSNADYSYYLAVVF